MKDTQRQFKRCIAEACAELGVAFSDFARQKDLREFLVDMSINDWSCAEIGVRALDQMCDRPPGAPDGVVCVAVIAFLDKTLGKPREDPDRLVRAKDLRKLISDSSTTPRSYYEWITAWYG